MLDEPDALGGARRRRSLGARLHFRECGRIVDERRRNEPLNRRRAGSREEGRAKRPAGRGGGIHEADGKEAARRAAKVAAKASAAGSA